MTIHSQILDLERLEIALKGGPHAKRDWLLSQRQETLELLAEIDRELEKLSEAETARRSGTTRVERWPIT